MNPRPLRWGILGAGNIAGKFAQDLGAISDRAVMRAVGARDGERARAFAERHGVETAYGSYQAVLDDPAVDVVYISLLNHQHAEWSIAAARAGKHVLCEKPAVMNATELERVLETVRAHDVFFMEAFAYRCHPRIAQLQALLASRPIGEVRMAHASFAFDGDQLDRPRLWAREQGGGSLMDVGVYPLSWLRMVARFIGIGEPDAACATAHLRASGVDEWAAGALRFPGGFTASFACAARCVQPNVAAIHGSQGWIEVVDPWRSTPGTAAFVIHRPDGSSERTACDDPVPRFAREALAVGESIAHRQSPACDWGDSRGQARLLDQLRAQIGVRWPGE